MKIPFFNPFRKASADKTEGFTESLEPEIILDESFGPQPIDYAEIKIGELVDFIKLAVKYADRELIAIGAGKYLEEQKKIRVESIYPVLDAKGTSGSVHLDSETHHRITRTLDRNREGDEVCVLHTHPGFSSHASGVDDGRGIRTASLLFDGKAVMIIVDPLSPMGIDISAYAIEPTSKNVIKIPFRLVP